MKRYCTNILVVLCVNFLLVGCKPDSLFEGHFYMQINVVNQTASELVVEHHESSGNFSVTNKVQKGSETLAFGEYFGSKKDEFPPEKIVVEALQEVKVYRKTNGVQQELSRSWFKNLDAFEISKEYWFGDCTVTYQINVTDEMF